MTRYSKVMTVFILFASVAFLGFTMTFFMGGPNWQARAESLSDFTFEQAGPNTPWTVKTRGIKEENAGSGKILPEAIISAQKKVITDQQARKQLLAQQLESTNAAVKQASDLIKLDLEAIEKRQAALKKQWLEVSAALNDTSTQAVAVTREAQGKYDIAKLRREEWVLMKNQLEVLKAERAAAEVEQKRLQDLLVQAEGNLRTVERRQQLLRADGARLPDDGAAPPYEEEPQAKAPPAEPPADAPPEE